MDEKIEALINTNLSLLLLLFDNCAKSLCCLSSLDMEWKLDSTPKIGLDHSSVKEIQISYKLHFPDKKLKLYFPVKYLSFAFNLNVK